MLFSETYFSKFHGWLVSLKLYHYNTSSGYKHILVDKMLEELQGLFDNFLEQSAFKFNSKGDSLTITPISDANVSKVLYGWGDEADKWVLEESNLDNLRQEILGSMRKHAFLFEKN